LEERQQLEEKYVAAFNPVGQRFGLILLL